MLTHRIPCIVAIAVLALCTTQYAEAKSFSKEYKLGKPIHDGNISIIPVIPKQKPRIIDKNKFLLLEQGIRQNLVQVKEAGATVRRIRTSTGTILRSTSGGRVNQVLVTNLSKQPLFIIGGEVIIGGKQDRVVQKDIVVPAKSKDAKVAVFCVEKGRWSGRTKHFKGGKYLVGSRLRSKAMFENQGSVWREVNRNNAKMRTSNRTDTYRAVLHNKAVQHKIKARLHKLHTALRNVKHAKGVIVAINGKIRAVDIYYSTYLFARVQKKVLRSYILRSLMGVQKKSKQITPKDAMRFVALAEKAAKQRTLRRNKEKMMLYKSGRMRGMRYKLKKRTFRYYFSDE